MKIWLLLAIAAVAGCAITGSTTKETPREEHFNYTVLFCGNYPHSVRELPSPLPGNCLEELSSYIGNSERISCALYSLDNGIARALEEKEALVITDSNSKTNSDMAVKRKSTGLMHNKFCVFDGRVVWTGSFNPTSRNSYDDVIIINSTLLANNYLDEFAELKGNSSSKTTTTKIILNNTLTENYFCPEDGCINILQRKLAEAESSIYFAAYSFTHPKIANELIIKSSEGVEIKGIIEKGGEYSQLPLLKSNNLAVEDANKRVLHHKFFIIDGITVITGSFNPTRNGDERNDENMLIIRDEEVARVYLDYFKNLPE
ncbi:hypothetical protein J4470_01165 [Candidatus Woesearchaeota archaeon]|nr:hypothetical protein [Candidatus Woesearchaeota archaeon]